MYKVYFDGIEQSENDIININEVAEFTIIREDGFTSDEQILREKTEMEIQFCGQAYSYICNKRGTDKCAEIEFKIEETDSGMYFLGIIPVTICELNLHERTGKTNVKDNSFSAYIRDFLDSPVLFNSTMSIGCADIDRPDRRIIMKKTHNNDIDTSAIIAFDVLDIFKYLVSYFSDGGIDVVSNYFAINKYAITTGFNMHNYGVSQEQIYPELSIQDVFIELRKKLRIYMGIEYNVANMPYLRIEQEDYFFSTTIPIFTISDIVPKTVETYDKNRNFNTIDAGSNITTVENEDFNFVIRNKYDGWIDGTFTGCGTCTGDKNAKLDLVSNYIIDSNIIYEALNAGNADYLNDDEIFLFQYNIGNVSYRTLISGEYIYNINLTNSEVLQNWLDYYGKCITQKRSPVNGFICENLSYSLTVSGGAGFYGQNDMLEFPNIVYDDNGVISTYTGTALFPPNILSPIDTSGSVVATYVDIPANGRYSFRATVLNLKQITQTLSPNDTTLQLQIIVYNDNTFASYTEYHQDTANTLNAVSNPISLIFNSPIMNLSLGNCVMVRLIYKDNSGNIPAIPGDFTYSSELLSFDTLSDGTCESIEYNDQNSKPFLLDFQYPLCYQDYATARDNKNGYVTVAGKRFWIKELTYRHKRLSTLKLMGNDSLCGCVPLADFSNDFNNDFT